MAAPTRSDFETLILLLNTVDFSQLESKRLDYLKEVFEKSTTKPVYATVADVFDETYESESTKCKDDLKTREDAEIYMATTRAKFVVRPSSRGPGYLALTYLNVHNVICNALIVKEANYYWLETVSNISPMYKSVRQLIIGQPSLAHLHSDL